LDWRACADVPFLWFGTATADTGLCSLEHNPVYVAGAVMWLIIAVPVLRTVPTSLTAT
jgi:hypothetical protein